MISVCLNNPVMPLVNASSLLLIIWKKWYGALLFPYNCGNVCYFPFSNLSQLNFDL